MTKIKIVKGENIEMEILKNVEMKEYSHMKVGGMRQRTHIYRR